MEVKITREEALRRWHESKKIRAKMIDKMEEMLYEDYKVRTGKSASL